MERGVTVHRRLGKPQKSEKYTELKGKRGGMYISGIGIRKQRLILKYMGGIPVQDSNVGWSSVHLFPWTH